MNYLKKYERINSRFLWSQNEILEGNDYVIWMLIDDIYNFYTHVYKAKDLLGTNKQLQVPSTLATTLPKCLTPNNVLSDRKIDNQARSLSKTRDHLETTKEFAMVSCMTSKLNSSKKENTSYLERTSHPRNSSISLENSMVLDHNTEDLTRKWLNSLNITVTKSQEKSSMLLNPYRNGTLLLELAALLENKRVKAIKLPKTVSDIEYNINTALAIITPRVDIPSKMMMNLHESIIRGVQNYIWGLLSLIRESYTSISNASRQSFYHLDNVKLGYNDNDLHSLEASLLSWIKNLGVLCSTTTPQSIIDIEEQIKNGTLLCKLVSLICGIEIKGVCKYPKSDASERANISKAMQALRCVQSMSQKY